MLNKIKSLFGTLRSTPNTIVSSVPREIEIKKNESIDVVTQFSLDELRSILSRASSGEIGLLWNYYNKMQSIDPFYGGLILHLRSAISQQPIRRVYVKGIDEEIESYLQNRFDTLKVRHIIHFLIDAHINGAVLLKLDWDDRGLYRVEKVPNAAIMMITDSTHPKYGELAVKLEDGSFLPVSELPYFDYLFLESEYGRYRYHQIGAARRCLPWFATKQIVHRDWIDFVQAYGHPIRIGVVPSFASDIVKSSILNAVKNLYPNSWAIIPPEADIQFKEPNKTGTVSVYKDLIDYVHQQYAVALIGTADIIGTNREGSFARLKISNSIRYEFIRNLAALVEEGLTEIVTRICLRRFVNRRNIPHIKLRVLPPTDQLDLARTIEILVRSGYNIPQSYVEEIFNIPTSDDR
mgnify:FL=1